jgi:hypothetical protein
MKLSLALIFGAMAFLSGCCTASKDNYQQALDSDLSEITFSLAALHSLDTTNTVTTRRIILVPVFTGLDLWSLQKIFEKANATPEQKKELISLARETLNYLLQHKEDLDPRYLDLQAGVRGLKRILTDPDDVNKLQELSDYFAQVQKKVPESDH